MGIVEKHRMSLDTGHADLLFNFFKVRFLLINFGFLGHFVRLVVKNDQVSKLKNDKILSEYSDIYLPATLKPERWSTAFFASKMSS